jgi:dGTPase
MNSRIKKHTRRIKKLFEMLFETYLTDMKNQREYSVIFKQFLKDMKQNYIQCHQPAEIVRDFISGMTDQYFLDQFPEAMRPHVVDV